ncbi:heme-binding domain-containing protein [Draconibacterium sp. IB214405]|uniref:heme-binding domain-containing protein n=1 Tax=Draconibacterium sp. IB214405 TaxID=3097352 RepID=UPI002A0D1761|nr:heme-binding domain-containing protein [Draconibacterium sp. IB214405]MDX8340090.1 heme-binding domain-containing protein [Draconibacterium sp. IB214405]
MKKSLSVFTLVVLVSGLVALAAKKPAQTSEPMPDDVKAVIQNSCYGCHNSESRNEDGKKEIQFDKLDELSAIKKIHAYKEIGEALEKNEMPPKKFLERFPDKALSEENKKMLMDWSKKEAEALVKEM